MNHQTTYRTWARQRACRLPSTLYEGYLVHVVIVSRERRPVFAAPTLASEVFALISEDRQTLAACRTIALTPRHASRKPGLCACDRETDIAVGIDGGDARRGRSAPTRGGRSRPIDAPSRGTGQRPRTILVPVGSGHDRPDLRRQRPASQPASHPLPVSAL